MHAFRSYIFAARNACDSGPTCYIFFTLNMHCDRPMACDEKRRPAAEFMRESIVFCSTCTLSS